jgi:hypothetical protein
MDQVESLLKRPMRYHNIDGMGELGIGFMSLGYGLLLWLQCHSPKDAVWHQMYAFVIYVGIMIAIIHYGTKAIKNHITYPRTGFVEYRNQDTVWWVGMVAAVVAVLVSITFAFAIRSHWDITASVPLVGLFLAACYASSFPRAVRWKWVVVWAMMLGSFAIAFLPAGSFITLAGDSWTDPVLTKLAGGFLLSILTYGAMLSISGGISFWLYLRHTQAPAQEGR